MPTYEYRCEKCQKEFELVLSMAAHERGGIRCPACGSPEVVQRYTPFFVQTSRKS